MPVSEVRLFGVGVGPGDPELMTLKARGIIERADVIAYPTSRRGPSIARRIAAPFLRGDQIEIKMVFPVTTETMDHADAYEQAMRKFYDQSAADIATHLDRGLVVAVLCEGDPFLYGSYMYLHERLANRYPTEVVPGVTSFSAAAAAAGRPLVQRDEVLTVLPGTLPLSVLTDHLLATDAAVVLKLGRTFAAVREAVARSGATERATYIERASLPEQRVTSLSETDAKVPYMSLLLIPSGRMATTESGDAAIGEVAVVGLGPAGAKWRTPEAEAVLAAADELVGYTTYLARVPVRVDQGRHASDNRAETERARLALDLAASGKRVAVVSSGDPGIFAMASALLEVVDEDGERYGEIPVRVVPGLSAMQAAAARVGAPLGHDFCVVSLSDQLKPWPVIESRINAVGAADLVLAIYNPASATRRKQLDDACAILLRHRAPETPVVVARDVGGPTEKITISTLAGFDTKDVDMRTMVIVGSSTTRTVIVGGELRVYTPRRYP